MLSETSAKRVRWDNSVPLDVSQAIANADPHFDPGAQKPAVRSCQANDAIRLSSGESHKKPETGQVATAFHSFTIYQRRTLQNRLASGGGENSCAQKLAALQRGRRMFKPKFEISSCHFVDFLWPSGRFSCRVVHVYLYELREYTDWASPLSSDEYMISDLLFKALPSTALPLCHCCCTFGGTIFDLLCHRLVGVSTLMTSPLCQLCPFPAPEQQPADSSRASL